MQKRDSNPEFDRLSWHDNALYGLRIDVGDHTQGDWRAELVLDIDHIVEWVCDADGSCRFRVAPATLTFHSVTDLRIAVDFGDSGGQIAVNELSIDGIARELVRDQKICFDRAYYRWRISFNMPHGGEIAFGASGFTQETRADPVLLDEQKLSAGQRG